MVSSFMCTLGAHWMSKELVDSVIVPLVICKNCCHTLRWFLTFTVLLSSQSPNGDHLFSVVNILYDQIVIKKSHSQFLG